MFFDKIFDFLTTFWEHIRPYWVIEQYNRGLILRFGKFKKVLGPGIHWKVPVIDMVLEHCVVPTTMSLSSQSLTTKDEKNIVIQAVVKYQISDIETFLLEVYDAVDAISDMTQAIIKTILMERTWEECKSPEIDNLISKKVRVEARKWGIEVLQVTLTDMGVIRSIRLLGETSL